jgi:hypothetical protein
LATGHAPLTRRDCFFHPELSARALPRGTDPTRLGSADDNGRRHGATEISRRPVKVVACETAACISHHPSERGSPDDSACDRLPGPVLEHRRSSLLQALGLGWRACSAPAPFSSTASRLDPSHARKPASHQPHCHATSTSTFHHGRHVPDLPEPKPPHLLPPSQHNLPILNPPQHAYQDAPLLLHPPGLLLPSRTKPQRQPNLSQLPPRRPSDLPLPRRTHPPPHHFGAPPLASRPATHRCRHRKIRVHTSRGGAGDR